MQKRKRSEKKVEEEYCWAMTQAEGLSWSSVTELGFQLDFLIHSYTVERRFTQYGLEQTANSPYLPQRIYCKSRRSECLYHNVGRFNHSFYPHWISVFYKIRTTATTSIYKIPPVCEVIYESLYIMWTNVPSSKGPRSIDHFQRT